MILLPLLAISILQVAQAYIKTNREERLESTELVQVAVSAKNLVWEEEGKELWIGDRMFDVASYSFMDGNFYLTGVYDDEETQVADTLLHFIFSKNGNDLLQLLLLLQCFTVTLFIMRSAAQAFAELRWSRFDNARYTNPSYLVLGPPPRP